MELKMNEYQLPEKILFNYEELKQELTAKVQMYETIVYTDEQIKEAKTDKANLNKLKKALNDERIRREKEYMQPFNEFKAQINEIIAIIDKPVAIIDKQVKEYEEKRKQDKYDEILYYWEEKSEACNVPEYIQFEQIFDSKWTNASVSMKSIQEAITAKIEEINTSLATLAELPEFSFEALEVYKTTLDINKAITEAKRMSEVAKAKAAHEAEMKAKTEEEEKARLREEAMKDIEEFENSMRAQNEAILEGAKLAAETKIPYEKPTIIEVQQKKEAPAKQWVSFSALLSTEDALALREFFSSRNIEFRAI